MQTKNKEKKKKRKKGKKKEEKKKEKKKKEKSRRKKEKKKKRKIVEEIKRKRKEWGIGGVEACGKAAGKGGSPEASEDGGGRLGVRVGDWSGSGRQRRM